MSTYSDVNPAFDRMRSGLHLATVSEVVDPCIECGNSTAFGSGRFVNRIPADNGEVDGWMCAECQAVGCDECQQISLDYEITDDGRILCPDCAPRECEECGKSTTDYRFTDDFACFCSDCDPENQD